VNDSSPVDVKESTLSLIVGSIDDVTLVGFLMLSGIV
jgi:hypothetical protein